MIAIYTYPDLQEFECLAFHERKEGLTNISLIFLCLAMGMKIHIEHCTSLSEIYKVPNTFFFNEIYHGWKLLILEAPYIKIFHIIDTYATSFQAYICLNHNNIRGCCLCLHVESVLNVLHIFFVQLSLPLKLHFHVFFYLLSYLFTLSCKYSTHLVHKNMNIKQRFATIKTFLTILKSSLNLRATQ